MMLKPIQTRLVILLTFAVAVLFNAGQLQAQEGAIASSGDCTVNIVRASARDIQVNGCDRDRAQLSSLQRALNSLLSNQTIEIARIDEMIGSLNRFFAESARNQNRIIGISEDSNDKITKVLDFLESFQEKPEDAAGLIPLISNGNLSHIQKKKPFGIQMVNVVRSKDGTFFRIVFRTVKSGPKDFDVAVMAMGPYSKPNQLDGWKIIGNLGSTCVVNRVPEAFDLLTNLSRPPHKGPWSTTAAFPQTMVVSPSCSGFITPDDLTLTMRFYFREQGVPDAKWQPVEFRFDVSKIRRLGP